MWYKKIKEIRVREGFKAPVFASMLGISQPAYSNIERGCYTAVPNYIIDYVVKSGYDLNSFFNDELPLCKMNLSDYAFIKKYKPLFDELDTLVN